MSGNFSCLKLSTPIATVSIVMTSLTMERCRDGWCWTRRQRFLPGRKRWKGRLLPGCSYSLYTQQPQWTLPAQSYLHTQTEYGKYGHLIYPNVEVKWDTAKRQTMWVFELADCEQRWVLCKHDCMCVLRWCCSSPTRLKAFLTTTVR